MDELYRDGNHAGLPHKYVTVAKIQRKKTGESYSRWAKVQLSNP